MAHESTLDTAGSSDGSRRASKHDDGHALIVVWAPREPQRLGEILWIPPSMTTKTYVFGRELQSSAAASAHPRLSFLRQRPDTTDPADPIDDPFLSREQLLVRADGRGISLENVGKRRLLGEQGEVRELVMQPGDLAELEGNFLFLYARRPAKLPPLEDFRQNEIPPFGHADRYGLVGESPAVWRMRDHVAFVGGRNAHVLITGESGVGKELAAQAIHALSKRAARPIVARSAATIPSGLMDAELFGSARNYPNAGMPERPGLFGEADGSSLFLDEIGELPESLQAGLLRVLDERGEYQRLGDARVRRSAFRLIGATNRSTHALKHDLAARFRLLLELPSLNDRREDIPLIARHLLQRAAAQDPAMGKRYFEGWDGTSGEPRCSAALMTALLRHRYSAHVRELDTLLWRALATGDGHAAELTAEVTRLLDMPPPRARPMTEDVTEIQVREALARCGGVQAQAWRDLGLANRYVLKRLIRKFRIAEET